MGQISWGLLLLRLVAGTLLIVHGVPTLVAGPDAWQAIGHTASCLGLHQFYLQVGAAIAIIEVVGAALILLGLFFRTAASLVLITSLLTVAIQFVTGHGLEGATNSLLLGAIFGCLVITGPGHLRLFLK